VNPLDKLKGILSQQPPASFIGTVIAIDAASVTVQSTRGRSTATRPSTLILSVGDEVLITNGAVQGRVKRAVDVEVYRL